MRTRKSAREPAREKVIKLVSAPRGVRSVEPYCDNKKVVNLNHASFFVIVVIMIIDRNRAERGRGMEGGEFW